MIIQKETLTALVTLCRSLNLTSVVDEGDFESCWQTWKDLFLAAEKDNIPTKRLRGRNPVPWLTGAVINLIKKKENVRRKLKLNPSESLKVKYQTPRSQVKRAIRESRDEFFESANIEFKSNPKRLWSVLKTRSKSRKVSPWQLATYVQPLTPQKKSQTFLITISLQCSLSLKRTKWVTAQGNSLLQKPPLLISC